MSTSKFKVGDIVRIKKDEGLNGLSKRNRLKINRINNSYSNHYLYFEGEEHPYGGIRDRCFELDVPDKPIKFSSIDKTGMNLKGVLDLYTELSNKNLILPE